MGVAFLARSTWGSPSRLVVVKRPHPHLMREPEIRRRFHHETAISTAVAHPALIRTIGAGEDALGPYLLLEYVHGTTLEDLIDRASLRRVALSANVLARLALDLGRALSALHHAQDVHGVPLYVLHRDVSPQNVMISSQGAVKLGDLGIAKSRLRHASTDARDLLGKLPYLAPEYLRERRLGPALDVYALGVTLYHAATGESPFRAKQESKLLRDILDKGAPSVADARPDLPKPLARLIDDMIAREWEKRVTLDRALHLLEHSPQSGTVELHRLMEELVGNDLRRREDTWGLQAGPASESGQWMIL